jgi:hypothetical protein
LANDAKPRGAAFAPSRYALENDYVADDVSKHGICHLCGSNGKLSFEHVPRMASGNPICYDCNPILARQ